MTRSQIIWATAFVLCMDRPLPNELPVVYHVEDEEEEEESEPDG